MRLWYFLTLLFLSTPTFADDFKIDEEFVLVTCTSAVKLTHKPTGFKLHSHSVNYGSGSGQQSVTGFPDNNDPNSYFTIMGAYGDQCLRGQEIPCGGIIRLKHLATQKHLHSHLHKSPLSGNQEVSCYEGQDTGDNWRLVCVDPEDTLWGREREVRLQHVDTGKWLTSSQSHKFRHPIPGQQEIYASDDKGSDSIWIAQEGIYYASPE